MAYNPEVSRRYYENNKEKMQQQNKDWRERNPEKAAESRRRAMKKYYEANKEKHLAKMRDYHNEHRDRINEQARERNKRQKELDFTAEE